MYVLGDIFVGNHRISQFFGANPGYYQQFGFAGHEGIDWATRTGVPILAPFNGVILRDVQNVKLSAYGNHIVVWDPVQRCAVWFCHLSTNAVWVGQTVKKGQILGYTGNTGNSTGPHLHVNFCETNAYGTRINTNNGYKGFRNILNKNLVKWVLTGR